MRSDPIGQAAGSIPVSSTKIEALYEAAPK